MNDKKKIWIAVVIMMALSAILIMTGCRSVKETTEESHNYSRLATSIDSLVHATATWQQDLYSKQSSLIDSVRQSEKRDSSHVVVINEKGDTVRERIEIYKYIERDHSSEKQETEMWIQKFHETDSLLHIAIDKQAESDSLLREHIKENTTQDKLTWIQRLKQRIGELAIMFILLAIAVYALYRAFYKK